MSDSAPSPDIVVVCTANVARSPLLAARLQMLADERLGSGTLVIGSAGMAARAGDPAAEGSRQVARAWGTDLDEHAATPVMYVPWDDVQLVLTMTRRHAGELVVRFPVLHSRTFTAREFIGRLHKLEHAAGGIPEVPSGLRGEVREHLAAVTARAHEHRVRWRRRHLDVPDPIGGSQEVYDRLGDEFVEAADRVAAALFGPPRA